MRFLLTAVIVCLPLTAQTLRVTGGLKDYQVVQRDNDAATILVRGSAEQADGKAIDAVLVSTTKTAAGGAQREIRRAKVASVARGEWTAKLERVPVGGPYDVSFKVSGTKASVTITHVLVGDLWVLAGQSNMEGVGDLVETQPSDDRVNMFDQSDVWRLAKDPLHSLPDSADPVHWRMIDGVPKRLEGEARDKWSRERKKGAGLGLPFAVEMVKHTGIPIGLVPCAHGGTSMDQWSPGLKDKAGASLYGAMMRRFQEVGGKVAGVLWYQGESDASAKAMPLFPEKFDKFVAAVRQDFNEPDLPFYWVQIGRHVAQASGVEWNQIQVMQLKAEQTIPHSGVVAAIDVALDDGIHVSTQDLKRVGKRLANLACHDMFQENAACSAMKRGPRPVSAKFDGTGMVKVTFQDVNGKLTADGRISGFTLVNGAGETLAAIYKAKFDPKDGNVVWLSVQGKMPEGAKLWYGATRDPYCNLKDSADMGVPVFSLPIEQ